MTVRTFMLAKPAFMAPRKPVQVKSVSKSRERVVYTRIGGVCRPSGGYRARTSSTKVDSKRKALCELRLVILVNELLDLGMGGGFIVPLEPLSGQSSGLVCQGHE